MGKDGAPLANGSNGNSPLPNGANGRDGRGRFARGNGGGPGNPMARRAGRLRAELYRRVTPEDLGAVIDAMLATAKAGDMTAAKELLNRLLGPADAIDVLGRLEALEAKLDGAAGAGPVRLRGAA